LTLGLSSLGESLSPVAFLPATHKIVREALSFLLPLLPLLLLLMVVVVIEGRDASLFVDIEGDEEH